MDGLSRNPTNYDYVNWRDTTQRYIDFLFNFSNTVDTLKSGVTMTQPTSWLANAANVDTYFGETGSQVIAFPSYFGMSSTPNYATTRGEGIAVLAAVLSGSLVGYDMTNYAPSGSTQEPLDFVKQMVNYYAIHNNERVILNNSTSNTGGSWWYELLPSALFTSLSSIYIGKAGYDSAYLEDILLTMATQWYGVVVAAGGANASFTDRKSYSIKNGTFTSGGWSEPDAAAGIAYVLYMAYSHFKNIPGYEEQTAMFLNGAKWCMNFLNTITYNPFYEVLVYFAPLVAARMNTEQGTNYNVTKMINWTLDGSSAVRGGWGMVNVNWGSFNTQGLMGSLTDGDGYSFMMNTFDAALGFFPMLKYNPTYAYSIGKWVLNVSDAAKNYYPSNLPANNQTCYAWSVTNGTGNFVAYEGLRKTNKLNASYSPAGWGDPLDYNWGPLTDFGYGNNHVGFFSGIEETNVSRILAVDLNSMDAFGSQAFPTHLYYNPYETAQTVEIAMTANDFVYNTVTGQQEITTMVNGDLYSFSIPADTAYILAVIPKTASITFENNMMYADGTYVGRYTYGMINASIITPTTNHEFTLNVQYPSFIQPTSVEVWHDEQFIGTGTVSGNAVTIALDCPSTGSGYLSVDLVARKDEIIIERKTSTLVLLDPGLDPVIDYQSDEELLSMFNSQYTSWNSGSNADKGAAENYKASATIVENGVRLKLGTSDTWGVAGMSKIQLDFDQTNILHFNVLSVSGKWTTKIFIPGGSQWGYYLASETSVTGSVTIDIGAEASRRSSSFSYLGVQDCYIWFIPVGAAQAEMTINDVAVYTFTDNLAVEPPTSSSSEVTSSSESSSISSSESSASSSESSSSSISSSLTSEAPSSSESLDNGIAVAAGITGGTLTLGMLGVFLVVKKGKKIIQ